MTDESIEPVEDAQDPVAPDEEAPAVEAEHAEEAP